VREPFFRRLRGDLVRWARLRALTIPGSLLAVTGGSCPHQRLRDWHDIRSATPRSVQLRGVAGPKLLGRGGAAGASWAGWCGRSCLGGVVGPGL